MHGDFQMVAVRGGKVAVLSGPCDDVVFHALPEPWADTDASHPIRDLYSILDEIDGAETLQFCPDTYRDFRMHSDVVARTTSHIGRAMPSREQVDDFICMTFDVDEFEVVGSAKPGKCEGG